MDMFPCKSGCSSRGPCPTGPKGRDRVAEEAPDLRFFNKTSSQ